MADTVKKMVSDVASGVNPANVGTTGHGGGENKKLADLARDTKDIHTKYPNTTDAGVKVSTLDNWVKIANEKKIGPHLLEDQIARERVWPTSIPPPSKAYTPTDPQIRS